MSETKTLPEDEATPVAQEPAEEDENLSDIDSHAGSERDAVSEAGSETPSISDKSSLRNSRSASNTPTNTRSTRSRDNPEFVAKQKSFMAKIQAATSGIDSPMMRPDTPGKRKRDSSSTSTQSSSKKRKSGKADNNGQDYQNDNYCWECHREGVFICCEMCPRVFHLKCAGMEKEPEEDWACSECHAVMQAENIENRSRAMQLISVEQLCTLLKFALNRLKTMAGMEPFTKPVDTAEFPTYDDVVVHPVDFTSLERNIKRKFYGSTEAFSSDARWIVHNSVIFNGANSKVTSMARSLVKILKQDMSEIETCPDCYMNAHQKPSSWFTEACRSAHPLIWARLKGFPFWPAKAVKWKDGNVDVRFFGRHDRSWVPVKECFLFSEQMPTPLKNRNKTLESCLQEVNDHIAKLRERFGRFRYAPHRVQFNPLDQDQIKIMLPSYKGPVPLRVRAQSRALSRLSGQSDDETSSVASTDSGASVRRRKRESGTSSATQETETEAEFPSQSSVQDDDERNEDTTVPKLEEVVDHSSTKLKDQEEQSEKKCEVKMKETKLPDGADIKTDNHESDEDMECEGYPGGNYEDDDDDFNLMNGGSTTVVEKVTPTVKKPKLIRVRHDIKKEEESINEDKIKLEVKDESKSKDQTVEREHNNDEKEDKEEEEEEEEDDEEEEEDDEGEDEDEELGRLALSTTEGEEALDEEEENEDEENEGRKELEKEKDNTVSKILLKDKLSSESKLKSDESELDKKSNEEINKEIDKESQSSSQCDKSLPRYSALLGKIKEIEPKSEGDVKRSIDKNNVKDLERDSEDKREKDVKSDDSEIRSDKDLLKSTGSLGDKDLLGSGKSLLECTGSLVDRITSYPGIVIKKISNSSMNKTSTETIDKCTESKVKDCSNAVNNDLKTDSERELKAIVNTSKVEDRGIQNIEGLKRNRNSDSESDDNDSEEDKNTEKEKVPNIITVNKKSEGQKENVEGEKYRNISAEHGNDSGSEDDDSDDENRLHIGRGGSSDEEESDRETKLLKSSGELETSKNKNQVDKSRNSIGGEGSRNSVTKSDNESEESDTGSDSESENEDQLEKIKREFASRMGISITFKDSEKKVDPLPSKRDDEKMEIDDEETTSKKDNIKESGQSTEGESEDKGIVKSRESSRQRDDENSRNTLFDAVQLMKNMGTIAITKLDKTSEHDTRNKSVTLSLAKDQPHLENSDEKNGDSENSGRTSPSSERQTPTEKSSNSKDMEQHISALGCSVSVTKALDKEEEKEKDKEKEMDREKEKEMDREREKEKDREREKEKDKEREKEKDKEKEREKDKEKVKMPSGVDTTRLSPSISIIAVSGANERHRAKTTIAPSASPNLNHRSSPTASGHSAPRSSPSVNAQNIPENLSSSSTQPNHPPRVSSASSSSSPQTANTGGIPPPPPLSHPQSSPSGSASSRGVFGPPPPGSQVLGMANNRAPIITSPGLRVMSGSGPGGIMYQNRMPGMPPTRHLPPEAGPLSSQLHKHSQKLAEVMRATLEDVLGGLVGTGTPEARLAALQLELERTNWRHQQELAEVRHNADVMLVEMRANLEAEKQRAVEEVKRQMEQQLVEVRRQMERQMGERLAEVKRQMEAERQRAVEETKKKQWCANCGKEALFFCCWNTSYCDYPCQQSHWPQHMSVCGQNSDSGGGGGGEGGSDSVNGEASAQSSRVSTPVQNIVAAQFADEEGAVAMAEELRRRKHRENPSPIYGGEMVMGRGSPAVGVASNMNANANVAAGNPNMAALSPGGRAGMATLGGPAMAAMAAMAAGSTQASGVHSQGHSNMKMHRYMPPNIMQQQQMYGGVDPRMMMMMGRGMPPGAAAAAMMRSPMHHFRPRYM